MKNCFIVILLWEEMENGGLEVGGGWAEAWISSGTHPLPFPLIKGRGFNEG